MESWRWQAIVVNAYAVDVGRLILRLRWAKDNPPSPPPSAEARSELEAFTADLSEGGDANRKTILEAAGVQGKIASAADCEIVPVQGNEIALMFDDEAVSQVVFAWKTIVVVPTRADLECLWKIGNLYNELDGNNIKDDQLNALGQTIFKRCR